MFYISLANVSELNGCLVPRRNVFEDVLHELADIGQDEFVGPEDSILADYGNILCVATSLEKL